MNRFHVHANVADLQASLTFYTRLFGSEPARIEDDYAKCMLADPPLNFAISTRGGAPGVDHLGIQADSPDERAALKERAAQADATLLDEGATSCCYSKSTKHWVTDPQGIAWEQFHTLESIPVYSEKPAKATDEAACCTPLVRAATSARCC
jgi:lactoylglutathione lyase